MIRREVSNRKRRLVRRSLAVSAFLVVALLLGGAWQLVQAGREVSQAKAEASLMRAALSDRDFVAAERNAKALQSTAAELRNRTDGLTWSAMSVLPFVGADLEAVSTASRGLSDLADGAREVTSVLAAPHGLLRGDRVSVSGLRRIAAATDSAARGLADLNQAVSVLEGSKLSPVRSRAAALGGQVDTGLKAVTKFQPLAHQLPAILGAKGPRHYLLAFQNNAEVRATGGLLGSAAPLTVDRGRISLEPSFSPVLKTETTKAAFAFSPAERTLYGPDLQRGSVFLNSMPDFRRTAELLRQGWATWFGGPLDGVISVDTVSIAYLLKATGPLTVMGQTLNSDNAVETLLSSAYARYPDNVGQDKFFSAVAGQLFAATTSGDVDSSTLFSAVRRMSDESRFASYFFDPRMSAADVDPFGERDRAGPAVTVGFNNTSGDKMSYYLRRKVAVASTRCVDGTQVLRGTADLSSEAPHGGVGLPPRVTEVRPPAPFGGVWHHVPLGSQLVQVVLRAPARGDVDSVKVDGNPVPIEGVRQGQHEVVTFSVEVPAQETRRVTWHMTTADDERGDVEVVVTPGVEPGQASSVAPSACS